MAVYIYKAMTKSGLIVRNKVESPTKQNLVKILKNNDMLPISVDKMPYGNKQQKKKKNISGINEFMKNLNTTTIEKENEPTTREKVRMYFAKSKKITLVFEKNKWRGKCKIITDNKNIEVDCYSDENDELLFINVK